MNHEENIIFKIYAEKIALVIKNMIQKIKKTQ